MATDAYHERAEQIERCLRERRIKDARRELLRLRRKPIPRKVLALYVSLARRSGLPKLGLRLLRRHVRPGPKRAPSADEPEIIEYAACLTRLGLVSEALLLLAPVRGARYPRVLFERAAALVREWRYEESIPLLKEYVRRSTTSYDKMVGITNLAAAYVYLSQFERAEPLLRELLHETSVRKYRLLLGNVLQVAAMAFVDQRKFRQAELFLERTARMLEDPLPMEALFLHKWRVMLALRKDGMTPKGRHSLERVKQEAADLGHWGTVRDCDRFLAVHGKDEAVLWHVYFGTPYPWFRAELLRSCRGGKREPPHYLWMGEPPITKRLDVEAGASSVGKEPLRPGSLPHRLLIALSSDFYSPFNLSVLFQLLYPGEWYHPRTSLNRVHQNLHGLRDWLSANAPGIELIEKKGDYRLLPGRGWGIRVTLRQEKGRSPADFALAKLRDHYGADWFRAIDAAGFLDASRRNALRFLNEGIARNEVERVGSRISARYRFLTEDQRKT